MSVASESSLPPMQIASSNDGSLPVSGRQTGAAPNAAQVGGVLGDMYALERGRSPVSLQGASINPKLMTRRDPNTASAITRGSAEVSPAGVVLDIVKSPQDTVVEQLTSRDWQTSHLAGPREHFPTDSAALAAQKAERPARPAGRSSGVQRGSSRAAKTAASRSPARGPRSGTPRGSTAAGAVAQQEDVVPGQRPKRASLYHDVGPVPRTPRGGAESDTSSVAAARRTRSASMSKYKNVRSVVRDYMDNRITEEEARFSALRARSPQHQRSGESPAPEGATQNSSVQRSAAGPAADQHTGSRPATPTQQRTPRARTSVQNRSLMPPDRRSTTPRSQRKVAPDFVPRCATMIPDRLKYHPKPIIATEECDPTTVDGVPYDEYRAQQEAEERAERDAKLRELNEADMFAVPTPAQSRARSQAASQAASQATSTRRSRQTRGAAAAGTPRGRSTSARAVSRSRRADPLQVADEEFMVPTTVDSEALSREDPYAPPKRSASNQRGRSPRAGSRGTSRSRTPRAHRAASAQQTPRDGAVSGSRMSQGSCQGVNPYAYRRKLVFPVAPPDLSQSAAVVPVA